MGTPGQLRRVEDRLIKDLEETTIPFWRLGEKYGVSKQAIFLFIDRKGIRRPKREHTEKCSICQGLIKIAKKPHSDFITSQTIKKQLGLGKANFPYHIAILRKKGLISQKFGRLRSRRVERAYQIYFKKRLPVRTIGGQVGLKNFHSILKQHKDLGWDVPDPLFTYDGTERRKRFKGDQKEEKGVALWKAARNYQKGWFVPMTIIQTLGILEILYILIFQKDRNPTINQTERSKDGT